MSVDALLAIRTELDFAVIDLPCPERLAALDNGYQRDDPCAHMKTMRGSSIGSGYVLLASAVVAMIACNQEKDTTTSAPSGKPVAANDVIKPRVTSPAIGDLLAGVPGTAIALGFVDMADSPWSMVTGGSVLPLDPATRSTLDKELREYVDRYLGVDLSKVQYAIGFVSGPPVRGAVLVKSVSGLPKLEGATDVEGGKLWIVDPDAGVSLALKGDVVVFGKDAAVREALETLGGKRAPVTTENKPLVEWLRKETAGAAIAFVAVAPKHLPLPPQIAGLQRAAATVGARGISAVVDGEDAAITRLQTMSDQAFAVALGEVEEKHQAALAGQVPPAEGVMAIIGSAYAKSYAAKLKPRRDGSRLSVSLEMTVGDPTMIVAGIGVLSAVAIPAFMDYMKKSKAAAAERQQLPAGSP